MTPALQSVAPPVVVAQTACCKLGLHDFVLDIVFCPEANLDNINELLPSRKGIPLILPNTTGEGVFQITIRSLNPGQ